MLFNSLIKLILIGLFIFTPLAFGSMEISAFSLMELGILLIIVLYIIQETFNLRSPIFHRPKSNTQLRNNPITQLPTKRNNATNAINPTNAANAINAKNAINAMNASNANYSLLPILLLSLFLAFILFQMIPLPAGMVKIISPKTYELRTDLILNDLMPNNLITQLSNRQFPISFFPFATKIEFFKWFALIGLFFFLLHWKLLADGQRATKHFIIVVILVGVIESLYGMFEYFSGHRHILYLEGSAWMSSVTGTFINRNYFAGYLLMVIPLSVGFLFSREVSQRIRFRSWRHRLASLDGKTVLLGFGVVLMILGLLLSASRMGIISLLLSFSLIVFLFRSHERRDRFSKTVVLIFGLAFLWAGWIGLDAVISRFFTVSDDFKIRWLFWENTFRIFKDFPLFGSGLGTFGQIFPVYRSFPILGFATHAENDFLQLASETGIIGVGLLFSLFLFLFIKAVSMIRLFPSSGAGRYIAIGGLVGILALIFHSLVERNIQVPANAFLFTFLWALVLKITRQPLEQEKFHNAK
jgi:O-antigen ligase